MKAVKYTENDLRDLSSYQPVKEKRKELQKVKAQIKRVREELQASPREKTKANMRLKAAYRDPETSSKEIQRLKSELEQLKAAPEKLHKELEQLMQKRHTLQREYENIEAAYKEEVTPIVEELAAQLKEHLEKANEVNKKLAQISYNARKTPLRKVPNFRDDKGYGLNPLVSRLSQMLRKWNNWKST